MLAAKEKRIFAVLTLITGALLLLLVRSYWLTIVSGIVLAIVFRPIYLYLVNKRKWSSSSSLVVTAVAALLIVVIPVIVALVIAGFQINQLIRDVAVNLQLGELSLRDVLEVIQQINHVLANWGIQLNVTQEQLQAAIPDLIRSVGNVLLPNITRIGGGLVDLITGLIVFTAVFGSWMVNQEGILQAIKQISPLPKDVDDLYFNRLTKVAGAMLRSIVTIALIQGAISSLMLALLRVEYWLLWGLLATVAALLPFGAGLILIPIGAVLMLTGKVLPGIIIILTSLLVVSSVDNVVRPLLVPKDVKLNPVLTLLALLGGIELFGIMGIVIGPLVLVLFMTSTEVYTKSMKS